MEKFLKNQQIPLTQVIDPSTGQAYYSPQNVVYQDKNNTGVTYLKNVIVDTSISASYALTASYALNSGGGGSIDTGSLLTTASFSNPNLTFTKGNSSTFDVSLLSLVPISASYAVSASFASTASFINPTTTNAFVQGGNSFGAQAILGTNDNQSLALETSGSIRMFISSSGLIGINKSSSNATLDVNGNTLTSGSSTWVSPGFTPGYLSPGSDGISIGNNGSGVHIRIRNSNRTSFDQSCGFGGAGSFGMTTSDRITVLTGGTTSGQTGLWVGSSANFNIFKVQGDSRVGINIATATSALHIRGTGTTSATTTLLVQNANASASLIIRDDLSVTITGSLIAPSITGSLLGTASYATQALSASYYGGTVISASYALTASYVSGSITSPGLDTQIIYNNGGILDANSGFVYSGSNVGIGTSSPAYKLSVAGKLSIVDGGDSIFIGVNAGKNDDGASNINIAIGSSSLFNNITGTQNVAIGNNSQLSSSASNNTSVGTYTLLFNTVGANNTAIGSFSQVSASQGNFNTSVGTNTLFSNVFGTNNTAVGSSALRNNITGSNNSGFGISALFSNTSGSENTAIGSSALTNNITGSENNALGRNAGRYFGTGTSALTNASASIFIGFNSRANAVGETNQIVIGNEALGLGSNSVVLGNDNVITTALKGNIGIGKINPSTRLDISGSTTITGSLIVTGGITGSLLGTASIALTASYIDGGTF